MSPGQPGDPPRRADERLPALLVVSYRLPGREAFVERYSANVSRNGIFIVTHEVQPVGTEIRFEIRSADGQAVFRGTGVVRWSRPHDPAKNQLPGLGVQFTELDAENREVLEQMLAKQAPAQAPPSPAAPAAPRVPVLDAQAAAPAEGSAPPAESAPAEEPALAEEVDAAAAPVHRPRPPSSWLNVVILIGLGVGGVAVGWFARGLLEDAKPNVQAVRTPMVNRAEPPPQPSVPHPGDEEHAHQHPPAEHHPSEEAAPSDAGMGAAAAAPAEKTSPTDAGAPSGASTAAPSEPPPAQMKVRSLKKAKAKADSGVVDLPMPPPPDELLEKGLRSAIASRQKQVQLCYDRYLKERPDLAGSLVLVLTTNARGRVAEATVENNTVPDWRVPYCIRKAFKGLEIAGVNQELSVEVPFHLTPDRSVVF